MVGTVTRRIDQRRSPTAPGGYVERGPYHQWTWKEKGKPRTRNLSPARARAWTQAVKNQRRLEKILLELRKVLLAILEETIPPAAARPKAGQRKK